MEITGKVTRDAAIKTLTSGKEAVFFSIADFETYKPKNSEESKTIATFFNCSFWAGTGVAKVLRKGAVVTLTGRLSARGYATNSGDHGASLQFSASRIKVQNYAPKQQENDAGSQAAGATENAVPTPDDLPF